jgi:hypothetical protein
MAGYTMRISIFFFSILAGPFARGLGSFFLATLVWSVPARTQGQLYVSEVGNKVGEYNASSGAVINANFITGLSNPLGLALSGNDLFVAVQDGLAVAEYNATSGASINASFVTTPFAYPYGIAISAGDLFVGTNGSPNLIGEYDSTTGAAINASFINTAGQGIPYSFAISGNDLFMATGSANICEYNVTTGALINASFITASPYQFHLAISGNDLYVSNSVNGTVGEYDATTGATINANLIPVGLNSPEDLAIAGNDLFVANYGDNEVSEYDATTGAVINAGFITGVTPQYLAVAPTPEPGCAALLAFGAAALLGWRRLALGLSNGPRATGSQSSQPRGRAATGHSSYR